MTVAAQGRAVYVRRLRRLARQRAVRLGCIPAAALLGLGAVLAVNVLAIRSTPFWVLDPRAYQTERHLAATLVTLIVLAGLATWLAGLVGAASAAKAAGGGSAVRRRLAVVWRRVVPLAWAAAAVRLLLLVGLAVAGLIMLEDLFGLYAWTGAAGEIALAVRHFPLVMVGTAGLLAAYLLAGPFARLRYSTALGALAATWVRRRDERPWAGINAWLGAEMLGWLLLLWGIAAGMLTTLSIFDPSYDYAARGIELLPALPPAVGRILSIALGAAALAVLHLGGMALLPTLLIAWARRRAARAASVRSPAEPV
jgi:hypothetical protein